MAVLHPSEPTAPPPEHPGADQPARRSGRPGRTRWALIVVAAVVALSASACDLQLLTPIGEGPMRYRDEVFTEVTTTTGVAYGSAISQTGATVPLALDIYEPTDDTVTDRPAIIWVHGGAFFTGTRTSPEIVDEATTFAKKGFVNMSITYRLSTNGCKAINAECLESITDAREDAQAAVRFLRANADTYGIDTDRIAIAGTSAGAITALNVAYGPDQPVGSSGNPGFPSDVRAAVSLSGARILTTPNPGEAAALLFHGTADPLVPYTAAQNTVAAAEAAELPVFLTTWDGAGHVPYVQHRTEILDQTTNFLFWTLDLPNAAA